MNSIKITINAKHISAAIQDMEAFIQKDDEGNFFFCVAGGITQQEAKRLIRDESILMCDN